MKEGRKAGRPEAEGSTGRKKRDTCICTSSQAELVFPKTLACLSSLTPFMAFYILAGSGTDGLYFVVGHNSRHARGWLASALGS